MKASNKYLFDQAPLCENCVYHFRDYECNNSIISDKHSTFSYTDYCSLNSMHKDYIYSYSHRYCIIIREDRYDSKYTPYFRCGPIGRFYEPKS